MSDTLGDYKSAIGGIDMLMTQIDKADDGLGDHAGIPMEMVFARLEALHSLSGAREAIFKLIEARDGEVQRHKIPIRMCECDDTDNSKCPVHTVGHPYRAPGGSEQG